MDTERPTDALDQEIFDALTGLIAQLLHYGEQLAERFDVPLSCVKALHRLDGAVTMKDLGAQLHCDPSFVTTIADALEIRGLATRQPHTVDRRIKNLVLTSRGLEVKAALERQIATQMPWARALDVTERGQLLGLIRKMSATVASPSRTEERDGEVNGPTATGAPDRA
ncbi:MAG: MarR family winged helix-turn-helix transcriptional regulator [Streptosporangiaceae bacterium]